VARLGGDEFTVVLTEVTKPDSVDALCSKILAELNKPFMLAAGEAAISASIGVTLYPGDASSLDELLRRADAAMYRAKHAGRNRYHFFTAKMDSAAT
jgi:diguanylate cyclase (GGDEF)-like protein